MLALVPLKPFAEGKRRLVPVLADADRERLCRAMAEDVLAAVAGCPRIHRAVVCSRDEGLARLAIARGASFLAESGAGREGLAGAVTRAAERLAADGERDMLVVPGDLPLLTAGALDGFLKDHARAADAAVTIAPDARGGGTNLLAWRPLCRFRPAFGEHSFRRHLRLARERGAQVAVRRPPGAELDVDEPRDVERLAEARQRLGGSRTASVLDALLDAGALPTIRTRS